MEKENRDLRIAGHTVASLYNIVRLMSAIELAAAYSHGVC